ncbi:ATP-binding protein [Variovorax sp. JS1663]|uniref:ATP-binding protein n=1 Tax=Variovorax sp. JS1663 TaxID=1851577 RepID=UPI000B349A3F|nr:ATP-binding protein [Variovorax sp. JS1663]OUM00715.1 hypothetical protein A8M77_19710 [Variovorax sp. JS1663]
MAHRLRKVFAVNIRNASTNRASAHVGQLDLRAHTMAIGVNGVGKSSYMRLIPLFYGATPERILRGTQKHNLISYTLPGPSSAVAFEYERESEKDLRLAVMFAKPGVERPEFMIIEGGYKESYFVDEDGAFVERDRFKDRLESMGIEVSPRFELHEYRSVILYEHRHTKEGRSLRSWAARHSLGPSSLYGLDLIAVAMTSEKLSFRDLQSLILERLNDSVYEGARNSNSRQMRKDRKDVDSWLANVKHAQDVLNETVRKKVIEEQVGKVGEMAMDLGSLRAACEVSIDRRAAELDMLDLEIGQLTVAIHELERVAAEGKEAHDRTVASAKVELAKAKADLEEVVGRERHFESLGVQAMVQKDALQSQYAHDKQVATSELKLLTERVNDAQQALQAALANIERDLQARKEQIQEQREAAAKEYDSQVEVVEQERKAVLEELDLAEAAPRRIEIQEQIAAHHKEIGAHDTLSKVAEAPKEALDHRVAADAALAAANEALSERGQHVERTGNQVKSGVALQEQAFLTLDQAEGELSAATAHHETLQAQLNPPAGSVLATLREHPPEEWANVAKVLDPERLLRTDLAPRYEGMGLGGGAGGEIGEVNVGPLGINVAPVELPRWATHDGARAQITESAALLQRIRDKRDDALAVSKKAQAELKAARDALQIGQHELTRAKERQVEAAEEAARAKRHVELEIARVRKEHADDAARLRSAVVALDAELRAIVRDEHLRRASVVQQFNDRVAKLRSQRDGAWGSLTDQALAAEAAAKEQRQRAQDAHAAALKGQGVDPTQVTALQERIATIEAELLSIAQNAHHVQAWRMFELELLPLKLEREARAAELRPRLDAAVRDQAKFEQDAAQQRAELTSAEARKRSARNSTAEELDGLRRLAKTHLAPYRLKGPLRAGDDSYYSLSNDTRNRIDMLEAATQKLEVATRDLCSKMRERSSEISQWLDGRQADHSALVHQREQQGLGEAYLRHERAVDWGRAALEWFEPLTHRQYHMALRHEMEGLFSAAESFVNHIANFESRVYELNRQFQRSLDLATGFKRFNNLQVHISSTAASSPALKALREMRDASLARTSSFRTAAVSNPELPNAEEVALMRAFRDQLPDTGTLQVNLDEHVRLAFELEEMGKPIRVDNDRSMTGLSSNGLTLVVTMMFLLGFLGIVRGKNSPVGMTWVIDEVGRVSPDNLLSYLDVLSQQNVTAVCAAPSLDPSLGVLFTSSHQFEEDGSIGKAQAQDTAAEFDLEEALQ